MKATLTSIEIGRFVRDGVDRGAVPTAFGHHLLAAGAGGLRRLPHGQHQLRLLAAQAALFFGQQFLSDGRPASRIGLRAPIAPGRRQVPQILVLVALQTSAPRKRKVATTTKNFAF